MTCTSVIASLKGTTSFPAAYGDGVNSIEWVDSGWEELGFRPGASGATDLRYEERDGQWVIVEADVYLNLHAHSWLTGIADENAEDGVAEIVGVMTHEFGHALGLPHPCEEGGEPEYTEKMTAGLRQTKAAAVMVGKRELLAYKRHLRASLRDPFACVSS